MRLQVWALCLVVARACFASPLAWPLGTSPDDNTTLMYDYPVVSLTTVSINPETYVAFIRELRQRLASPGDTRHGIPVMRSHADTDIAERFVLVELSNSAGLSVTLALDVINGYVVGYRSGDYWVFLMRDDDDDEIAAAATMQLFRETTIRRITLEFTGSYQDLQQRGGRREDVPLGIQALEQAVSTMYSYPRNPNLQVRDQAALARAFLITIQMVSEAARFNTIEASVCLRLRERDDPGTAPDTRMISLENGWDRLSSEIQYLSNDGVGVFRNAVRVQTGGHDGEAFIDVDNLARALEVASLALMLFRCNNNQRLPQLSSPLIRPTIILPTKSDDRPTCPEDLEPTVQIAGPGGLCVDVKNGWYNNGNPIQLYPCRSSDNTNQLWTLRRDGTLRSNGKCLASYGYTPGDYIMIYDCGLSDKFKWQVWDNGTIISKSGLVLAARSLESGTTLTAEVENSTIGQSWRPSNNTQPLVAPIVGISSGLCLQAQGTEPVLNMCVTRKPDQAWALYPDGSIRPNQTRVDRCLTVVPSNQGSSLSSLKISVCEPNSFLQRWVFPNDGTIMNLFSKHVMDLTPCAIPSLGEIIVASSTGSPSQMWKPLY
uniref:Uncharacterized protein n=1 Tax=Avena sativa TaxID=4498 RepID=A0ACD5WGQ7_AVESA